MRHFLVKHTIFVVLLVYLTEAALDLDMPALLFMGCMWTMFFGVEVLYHRFFPRTGDFPL